MAVWSTASSASVEGTRSTLGKREGTRTPSSERARLRKASLSETVGASSGRAMRLRDPCGSVSIARTRLPRWAAKPARFNTVVVLPTPPFRLATAMTCAFRSGAIVSFPFIAYTPCADKQSFYPHLTHSLHPGAAIVGRFNLDDLAEAPITEPRGQP